MSRWLRPIACTCITFLFALSPSPSLSQEQEPRQQQPAPEPAVQDQQTGTLIMPGQGLDAEGAEQPAEQSAAEKTDTAAAGRTKDSKNIYIIVKGDTLWDISNSFLKDPFLWPLIWKVNPYITNPDLIYPGNKLVIPDLSQIERAMERPAEQATEQEKPGEREVAGLPKGPAKPTDKEPEAEEPPPTRKLILPEEMRVPIIDKYAMVNAGFVNAEETDDRIVGSLEPKTIFAYDDILYVKTPSQEGVEPGDRFLIYKPVKRVRHPDTGSTVGRLIKVLGILQITAKDTEDVMTARVTLSFDAIAKGDLITPYQEPTLVYPRKEAPEPKDITGFIIEVVDGRTINAQIDIVYLDLGTADGVEPGDRFTVYVDSQRRGFPRKVLGEVQVFLVKERTSTAIVKKSVDVLAKGDRIEYKK